MGAEFFPHRGFPISSDYPLVLRVVGIVLYLILLFFIMAESAERFFCPSMLQTCKALKISPDVAGATLMAFGNGAPVSYTLRESLETRLFTHCEFRTLS